MLQEAPAATGPAAQVSNAALPTGTSREPWNTPGGGSSSVAGAGSLRPACLQVGTCLGEYPDQDLLQRYTVHGAVRRKPLQNLQEQPGGQGTLRKCRAVVGAKGFRFYVLEGDHGLDRPHGI